MCDLANHHGNGATSRQVMPPEGDQPDRDKLRAAKKYRTALEASSAFDPYEIDAMMQAFSSKDVHRPQSWPPFQKI